MRRWYLALVYGAAEIVRAAPAIPFKPASAAGGQGNAVALLLASVLAIALAIWARKRWLPAVARLQGERPLRVLQTQRLGPGAMVSVVEFAGMHYLVAQSQQGVNCIASAPAVHVGDGA